MIHERGQASLGEILPTALRAPQRLTVSALGIVASALDSRGDDARILALRTLAALAYARPDLVRRSIVGPLARIMAGPVSAPLAVAVAETFQLLSTTSSAPTAARALADLLGRRRLAPTARAALLAALRSYAQWRPHLFPLEAALRAGRAAPDGDDRDLILREVIERHVFTTPRLFSDAMVSRLIAGFGDRPRLRYTLASLLPRRGFPRAARARVTRWLTKRSTPAPIAVAAALGQGPRAVLIIHNIADGQGDEIVRTAPLVQALLDANPSLTATILSQRVYLYDHPRVTGASIHAAAAVDRVLRADVDGLVDFNARTVPGASCRPDLASRITEYLDAHRPGFVIRAVTGRQHFAFETVRVGDQSLARGLRLHRVEFDSAYDATERLLFELGLPQRAGQERPRGDSLLVGTPSLEAQAVWMRLRGPGDRPVALVNAFGGANPLKGFTRDKAARLAIGLGGLIDEGFAVVLLPHDQPWGGKDVIAAALRHLDPARRSCLAVAPDPAGAGDGVDLGPAERPGLSRADRVMRLFKYFAAYADLVVTVEGWLMHLAYAMGRPFRVLLAPYSSPFGWLPRGRGPRQQLVTSMSRVGVPDTGDFLGEGDLPSAPFYPRKPMLMATARGLGQIEGTEATRLLFKLLGSPDRDLREVAVEVLGRRRPISRVKEHLIAALGDADSAVRATAARALLDSGADCDWELGSRSRAQLLAHEAIARQDWAGVEALGAAGLPALAVATRDAGHIIQREARVVAARLIGRHAPAVFAKRRS